MGGHDDAAPTEAGRAAWTPLGGAAGRQRAGERLRQAILAGDMAPGQRLIEEELAGMLSVTRASLRGALFDLTAEGLVERIPNRGARVRAVTLGEAVAITECRMALEGLCAAKAAERITEPRGRRGCGSWARSCSAAWRTASAEVLSAQSRAAPADAGDLRPDGGGRPARAAERAAGPAPVPAVAAPRPRPDLTGRAPGHHRRNRRAPARPRPSRPPAGTCAASSRPCSISLSRKQQRGCGSRPVTMKDGPVKGLAKPRYLGISHFETVT